MGDQRVMDVTLLAPAGATYTSGGDSITPAQVGLDVVDYVVVMVDGFGSNTNGVALVAPNLGSASGGETTIKMQLFGTGAASGDTFAELGASTAVAALQLHCLFYGV
jgi:hypothetical protein